jgi:enoyl-CoA hydratase/carnithine racemase
MSTPRANKDLTVGHVALQTATLCRVMKEKPVLYEVDAQNRTAVFTLNRPSKQNAFNNEVYNSLVECLDAAESDTRVIAVVLTANGPAFSSGADLNEVTEDLADSSKFISIAHRPPGLFMTRLLSFKKLLIAAVNGPAVGTRCSFIMHVRILMRACFGLVSQGWRSDAGM